MKATIWLGGGALLFIVLIIAMQNGDRRGDAAGPSVGASAEAPEPAATAESTRDLMDGAGQSGDANMVLWEPDRDLNAASDANTEEAPRTIFGTVPVKKSIELPIVDPATLPFDPKAGRIEVSAVARGNSAPGEANDPMSTLGDQFFETDDGPLAGVIPQPDPSAPGPAGLSGLTVNDISDTKRDEISDTLGPGRPIDPEEAAVAPPNYILPGDDVIVEDPDSSPGAP